MDYTGAIPGFSKGGGETDIIDIIPRPPNPDRRIA